MKNIELAEVQKAINALELVQGLILKNSATKSSIQPDATRLNIFIHLVALSLAIFLACIEIFDSALNTRLLLLSKSNYTILIFNVANIALGLLVLTIAFHFLIVRRARKLSADFQDYVKEHFQYLSNFSFLTDLFVKFAIISIIIIAQKPEFVAPILSLFIGDYLFQGRFFVLPIAQAYIVGIFCWLCASVQLYLRDPNLLWSFLLFSGVCLISLCYLKSFNNLKQK